MRVFRNLWSVKNRERERGRERGREGEGEGMRWEREVPCGQFLQRPFGDRLPTLRKQTQHSVLCDDKSLLECS